MDNVVVRSDNQDIVNEGMLACCNVSTLTTKKAYSNQNSSNNFLRSPVVAAVDGIVGIVDYALASDRDLIDDLSVKPLNFIKEQCVRQNFFIASNSGLQLTDGDGDVFAV